jgi:hypothetical protein
MRAFLQRAPALTFQLVSHNKVAFYFAVHKQSLRADIADIKAEVVAIKGLIALADEALRTLVSQHAGAGTAADQVQLDKKIAYWSSEKNLQYSQLQGKERHLHAMQLSQQQLLLARPNSGTKLTSFDICVDRAIFDFASTLLLCNR